MKDRQRTKDLGDEVAELRMRVAELEAGQRAVEDALRQRTADLQMGQERLDRFGRALATDLRGPLGLMVSYAQLLEQDYAQLSDEELRRYLRVIVRRGRDMVGVIDELLRVRSEPPTEVVEAMGPLNMASILSEVLGRLEYLINEYRAEIVLPPDWPTVTGHAPWVEEIWTNLLNNAIRYSGYPPRVELGAGEEGSNAVRFWVRDNGPGLSAEEQLQLFAGPERNQNSEYGLGLVLVRRVVEKLGGQVGVESRVGQGSTFFFTLPVQ